MILMLCRNNAQLKEYIPAGTEKTDFLNRIAKAFGGAVAQRPSAVTPSNTAHHVVETASVESQSDESSDDRVTPPPRTYDQQLADRRARLTEQRQRMAEETARRRKEKGKAKADSETENDNVGKPKTEAKKAAEEMRQRKLQAEQERKRILAQIEADKAERKARAEERKAARDATAQEMNVPEDARVDSSIQHSRSTHRYHDFCSLQVRLFDGTTIRTRLPSTNTVRENVRKWLDEQRGNDRTPYTLRVIYPNKLIEETEEDQSLEELGLTPSATLVLVPVEKFTTAYDGTDAGLLRRLIGLVVSAINLLIMMFTSMFSWAKRDETEPQPLTTQSVEAAAEGHGQSRVKGFRNPNDAQRDYQLYNGNSVSQFRGLRLGLCADPRSLISSPVRKMMRILQHRLVLEHMLGLERNC
jgi:hypothetical protein